MPDTPEAPPPAPTVQPDPSPATDSQDEGVDTIAHICGWTALVGVCWLLFPVLHAAAASWPSPALRASAIAAACTAPYGLAKLEWERTWWPSAPTIVFSGLWFAIAAMHLAERISRQVSVVAP